MKKILFLVCLLIGTTVISSFKIGSSVDTIEFYKESQSRSLDELISATYNKSKTPIIYFYADWCGPCVSFKKSLTNKHVQKAFSNATLIKVNIDFDQKALAEKYLVRAVPTYIKVNKKRKVIAKITSGKWGKDIPKNIAPVMDNLVNNDTYDND